MALAASVPAASPGPAPGPWLLDLPRDLLLFIATPALLIPLFALLRQGADDVSIYAAVAAFGATGHHLPGLLRAYGDRELFARYRTRFVLGPLLLAALCLGMSFADLRGLMFLSITWGTWHGLAQVYGLGRIYDARTGYFSPAAARLDKALCIAWFGGGLVLSSGRSADLLEELYKCGVPPIAPAAVHSFQQLWLGATLLLTALWLAHFTRERLRSSAASGAGAARPNDAKLLLFVSSFSYWWYAAVPVEHAIIGIALFEVFHDVQYLSIVWLYNRKLAIRGQKLGRFNHFVFEPGLPRVLIYLGLVAAYGGIDFFGRQLSTGELNQALGALLLCSGFLHFYYDSFLWNLRDASTRQDLDVSAAPVPIAPRVTPPAWLAQAWNWSWLVLPLSLLLVAQGFERPEPLVWQQRLAESLPGSAVAQERLAAGLRDQGRLAEALLPLERAIELEPDARKIFAMRGELHAKLGNLAAALADFARAAELDPRDAVNLVNLGLALQQAGSPDAARVYRRALELDPGLEQARSNLALLLEQEGQLETARAELQRVTVESPEYAPAWFNLGMLELRAGRPAQALAHLEQVLRLDPGHAGARRQLPRVREALAAAGRSG